MRRIRSKSEVHGQQKLVIYVISCLEIFTIFLISLDLL